MIMRFWRALGLRSMYKRAVSSANMCGRQKRRDLVDRLYISRIEMNLKQNHWVLHVLLFYLKSCFQRRGRILPFHSSMIKVNYLDIYLKS